MTDSPQHLELELGPLAHGGHTVARTQEGRVVFVRHGAPGERVRVRLSEAQDEARFWRGDVVEVLSPVQGRRARHPWEPADSMLSWASGRAPVGGAELGHLELELQRRLKTEVLRVGYLHHVGRRVIGRGAGEHVGEIELALRVVGADARQLTTQHVEVEGVDA